MSTVTRMNSDRWTFPMMIVMDGNSETEAWMRFGSASLVTLRIAAYPSTPLDVITRAERAMAVSPTGADEIIDEWCRGNADPGAIELQIVKYKDDICEAWSPTPVGRPMAPTADGAWFEKTTPLALPIPGPEISFKVSNRRDTPRVVHLIAGLMS